MMPWSVVSCYIAAVQGLSLAFFGLLCLLLLLFFPFFSFPLMIWSFQQISGGSLHTNAPKFLGLGSCGTASHKWCDGLAVVAPLRWLIYSRSWVKHGSNCQKTQAGKVQNLTQISSEMSGRVITLLWSYMRWLVNQPVSWCVHTHTHMFSHVGYWSIVYVVLSKHCEFYAAI